MNCDSVIPFPVKKPFCTIINEYSVRLPIRKTETDIDCAIGQHFPIILDQIKWKANAVNMRIDIQGPKESDLRPQSNIWKRKKGRISFVRNPALYI